MDLPRNPFKAALAAGRPQIGIWLAIPGSLTAEAVATCGFDWMVVDTEHTVTDLPTVLSMLQAAAPYPTHAVVRTGWNDAVEIKRVMDAGAQTILVPYVQSAEEARRAVAAVRYPPEGMRGVAGLTRASRYGLVDNYTARANEEVCLLVQVETAEALGQIEAIAAVPGIDGIFVGPADLAASLGYPGNQGAPEVKAAILDAISRIAKAGKPPGILTLDTAMQTAALEAGALFMAVELDLGLVVRGARSLARDWAARLGR